MRAPALLTRNLRLKALCIIAAMVTWAGVVYAANPPETRIVTVAVPQGSELLPAGYLLANPIPSQQIRISGTRARLDAFDDHSLVVTADYRQIKATGTVAIPLHVVNLDSSVVMGDGDWPHSVTATVDVLDSKILPVTIVANPPPPFGYIVAGEAADPTTVTVTGPRQELSHGVIQARVTLDLSNQKTNLQTERPVLLFDSSNHEIHDLALLKPTVVVSLELTSTQVSRSTAVVPKTSGQVAAGHQLVGLSVDPPTIVINGPRDLLNALDAISTAVIALDGLSGDTTVQVKIAPPAGVTATPQIVTVHLHIVALAPAPTPAPTPQPSATPAPTA